MLIQSVLYNPIRYPFLIGLAVEQRDYGTRKVYKSLKHWRRDAESSCSEEPG